LIRLESPAGDAVAWVCPALGANVVAYAVKTLNGWGQVLHQDGPDAMRERPSRFGLPILFPFPGHMAGGRYTWRGTTYTMPMLNPSAPSFTHGFAHQRPWRVTHQDSTSLTAIFDTRTDLDAAQRAGYPFDVTLTVQVSLTVRGLGLALTAENVDTVEAPVGIGLHPYFDPGFYADRDRTALSVFLPGQTRRLLTASPPIPTGERAPADASQAIQPVPLGQLMLMSRTGFGARPTARIVGGDATRGTTTVELVMDEGWEDVLLFAPADGPSISIEPHTCAPGASSLPESSPDGQRPLAQGERLAVRTTIRTSKCGG
jgi:aldose 1-epimerase